MSTPALLPLILTCLAKASSLGLVSLIFCTLMCVDSIPYPLQEREAGLVMNHWFSFTVSYLTQVFQGGENSRSVQWPSHSPCFSAGRTVCASSGPCLVTPQWWHSHLSLLCVILLDSLSPAGGMLFLCQECSICVTEEDFLFTFTPWSITLFSSLCTCEGIPSCPVCPGHGPKGFDSPTDTAVVTGSAAECEITILEPAELTAHWEAPHRAKGWAMFSWVRWN